MDFQGFQNSFPSFLIVVSVILFWVVSWLAYRKQHNLPFYLRVLLTTSRAVALTLLLFLLMNPFFYTSKKVEVKPEIAVYLDDSESAGIIKGSYNGIQSYDSLLQELNFESRSEIDIRFYSIGERTVEFSRDSLRATSPQTNLSSAVNSILELEETVKAAVMITDGIVTYGKNPAFTASSSTTPIFTIALGDTAKVKDIAVTNVITNPVGYTDTRHTVEAEITQSGFRGSSITLHLLDGDEIIQQKEVDFNADNQVLKTEFEIELSDEGIKQYDIRVDEVADEWTTENNNEAFSIDVLDSKVRILHVSFEIHPDVKMVRSILSEDINNEVTTLTWLGANRYVENFEAEEDYNLIIIHGAPPRSLPFDLQELINETPVIFFNSPSALNNSSEKVLLEAIGNQSGQIRIHPLMTRQEHPIMELPAVNYNELPLLHSPLRTSSSSLQTEHLFALQYENTQTENPIISITEQGNLRWAHVLPWNWFRLYQSNRDEHREFVTQLFTNLVSWTSSDPDSRMLRVSPAKQIFGTSESPIINANLQNESGEAETNAIIEIEVISEDSTSRTFNMDNSGNGNFMLDLPRLSEGLYTFEAVARKGNREMDRSFGEFLVSNTSSELNNTIRNDDLLKTISLNTNATFFTFDNAGAFWDSLTSAGVLQAQTQINEQYTYPVRSVFWFVVILILLTSEWLIRKFHSLP